MRRIGQSLKPFRRPRLWSGLWMLAIALVVALSLIPAPDLGSLPMGSDKLQHLLAYAALAAGAVQLYARRLALLSACVCLGVLGIALEHAQGTLTDYRMMDANDALANGIGVLVGLTTVFTPWRDALLRFDARWSRD